MPDSEPSKTIYNEYGQIADQNTAHVVADEENVARNLEIALETEAQSGLSPKEQTHLKIIHKIQQNAENIHILAKDPDGRTLHLDSEGHPYLILDTPVSFAANMEPARDYLYLLTIGGLTRIAQIDGKMEPEARDLEESVWGEIASSLAHMDNSSADTYLNNHDSVGKKHVTVARPSTSIDNPQSAMRLKALLDNSNRIVNAMVEEQRRIPSSSLPPAIPSNTSIEDMF